MNIFSFPRTFTVRNADVNTFELYDVDGTTAINVSNAPTASQHRFDHTCLSLSNVQGEFVAGETITGGTSAVVTSTQADRRGFKAVREYDFRDSKQISMAGTPVFTADTALDSTNGEATILSGNINVTNNTTTVIGNGTRFTEELEVGDRIEVNNVNGVSKNAIVQVIIDNSNMVVETTFDATNNISSGVITKTRAKLNGSEKNISIFELPYQTIKTLKTTGNSEITDTSFKVRRQFTQTLSSNGDATITAGTNETFAAEDNGATPVEIVLVSLASCLTAGIAAVAQHRDIQLHSCTATIEGGMDIQGILGIDAEVRNGFNGIRVHYDIDADATADEISALVAQSQKRSAVYDIVTNPTNVTVDVN